MPGKQSKKKYGNESIKALKGADRVRKRPAVIFGSNDLDGCEHAAFEIVSNSIDEAREGYGNRIVVTRFADHSIEVQDFGRGIPVDFNKNENCYNWELLFCELYAGGKYKNSKDLVQYEYALGTNGLGACATQYASEYMHVKSYNGKTLSEIDFAYGEPTGELRVSELKKNEIRTGTVIHWKPDNTIFTSIKIRKERFEDILKRQAVVNSGIKFCLRWQEEDGSFTQSEYVYENGIVDYVKEIAGNDAVTQPVYWEETVSGTVTNSQDGDDGDDSEEE